MGDETAMSELPRVALLMETSSGYARGVLRGIARYVHLHGPWVIDLPAEHVPPFELSLPTAGRWHGTGIIGRILNERIARDVLSADVPTIGMDLSEEQSAADSLLSRISELSPDSLAAGRVGADYYLERGFRHFAFCGFAGQIWSRRRREGFCLHLAEAGFTCNVLEQPHGKTAMARQQRGRIISWLQSLERPVGLMACNDRRGRQVLEACLIAGIHVPDEVAVVGVDDDHILCRLSNPPLSSIAFNAEKGGFQAAELLDGLMSARVTGKQRILADALGVTTRYSSDIIAVDDRHVSLALRFIRDNARHPICVDDVVAYSGIGRRALEIRIQKAISRSIREEIQRTHLEWAKRLLAETELPAGRIADLSGFNSFSYLSKVFRRATGMTLAQYRRHARPE